MTNKNDSIIISAPWSKKESRLWGALADGEARIVDLYALVAPPTPSEPPLRSKQQRVGSYISKMNRKLKEARYKIVTGDARYSYKVVSF